MGELSIFISHSASDVQLAKALTHLVEKALKIPARQIRCTSVEGYRLPVGAATDEQVRDEVLNARMLIGVVTPAAVASAYVMFELGARWGANRPLAPVLAGGADTSDLSGPLAGVNALHLTERHQVIQLVEDLEARLDMRLEPGASYQEAIDAVVSAAERRAVSRNTVESELLALVSTALTNVHVGTIRVTPPAAPLHTQVLIDFEITNTSDTSLDVWLGADIQYRPDAYFYNTTEDKVVLVDPGRHVYQRRLTLAAPLTSGLAIINAGVWLGTLSDTSRSVRLALHPIEIAIE